MDIQLVNTEARQRSASVTSVLQVIKTVDRVDDCFNFILAKLSDEEKSRFGTTLLRKLLHGNGKVFDIDADSATTLLGYSKKSNFVRVMKGHLIAGEHYKALSKTDDGTIAKRGRPSDDFLLTIDGVRILTMLAETEEGKMSRNYYLKLEDSLLEFGRLQWEIMAKKLEDAEKITQEAEGKRLAAEEARITAENEARRLRGGHKIDAHPGDTVYLYVSPDGVKVGRTRKLEQRAQTFKTVNPGGSFEDWLHCVDSRVTEKAAHHILHEFQTRHNSEWFDCSWEMAKEATKCGTLFLDGLHGHASALLDYNMSDKLRRFLSEFYDFYDKGNYVERAKTDIDAEIRTCEAPAEIQFRDWGLKGFKGRLSGTIPMLPSPVAVSSPANKPPAVDATVNRSRVTVEKLTETPEASDKGCLSEDPDILSFCEDFLHPVYQSTVLEATVVNAWRFANKSDDKKEELLDHLKAIYGLSRREYNKYLGDRKSVV